MLTAHDPSGAIMIAEGRLLGGPRRCMGGINA